MSCPPKFTTAPLGVTYSVFALGTTAPPAEIVPLGLLITELRLLTVLIRFCKELENRFAGLN